jgi:hypothetical protein
MICLLIMFIEVTVRAEISQLPSLYLFSLIWVSGQLARTSINPTGPEVNNHVSLQ